MPSSPNNLGPYVQASTFSPHHGVITFHGARSKKSQSCLASMVTRYVVKACAVTAQPAAFYEKKKITFTTTWLTYSSGPRKEVSPIVVKEELASIIEAY